MNKIYNEDNLVVLKTMVDKSIDFIYIDPPYNTWKKREYNDKIGSHKDYDDFIRPRLIEAQRILTDDGIIFISIDDIELYHLKIICDDVFGEKNFVKNIIWQKNGQQTKTSISTRHEYILCYKKKNKINFRVRKNNVDLLYKLRDEICKKDITFEKKQELFSNGIKKLDISEGLKNYYLLEDENIGRTVDLCNFSDKTKIYGTFAINKPIDMGYNYDIVHPNGKICRKPERMYAFKEGTFFNKLKNNLIIFGDDETTVPRQKYYLKEHEYQPLQSVLSSKSRRADVKIMFSKPIDLLEQLISISKDDAIILDFFAGSGSTGIACNNLSRRFILVEKEESIYKIMKERLEKEDIEYEDIRA